MNPLMRVTSWILPLALVVLSGCADSSTITTLPEIHSGTGALYETVFDLPVGDEGVHYRGVGQTEMEGTGPSGFMVDTNGDFYIADLIGNRILHTDATGKQFDTLT